MAHVEDRWHKAGPDGETVEGARYGTGRRWRVRYLDPDGRERNRSFDRKADAERFRTQVEADVLRGTYMDPDAGKITLRRYAAQWLAAQGFDAVTREAVESRLRLHVLPVLGDHRLDALAGRPSLIQAWLSGLKLAPSTAGKVFSHLNTVMLAALADGLIGANPCRGAGIRKPRPAQRRVVPWTPAQSAAMRAALASRYRALVDAGNGLGLRQSELFGLSVDELEFMRRVVQVRRQVKMVGGRLYFATPKGGKERTVPLAGRTGLALSAHIAEYAAAVTLPWHEPGTRRHGKPHTASLLFTRPRGLALDRGAFNGNVWRPARKTAGLDDDRVNGCHAMRHVYASTLIARGVDVRTVAEYLGHSDGGALVLRTYAHLMPDAEDRARRAIEDALYDADSEADGPETAPGQVNRP